MQKKHSNVQKLVITSVLIAISVVIGFAKYTVPIFGAPVFRVQFNGPFIKFVAFLFGPVYGGIAAAVSDFLGVMIGTGGWIPPLTIVAFLKGLTIGLLWKYIKQINIRVYNMVYFSIFVLIFSVGAMNLISLTRMTDSSLATYLANFNKKTIFVSTGLIAIGLFGLIVQVAVYFYYKKKNSQEFYCKYLKLLTAIGIPSLIFTTVNTLILQPLFAKNTPFIFYWIPRFIEEMFMVLYNTYAVLLMMKVYEMAFGRKIE